MLMILRLPDVPKLIRVLKQRIECANTSMWPSFNTGKAKPSMLIRLTASPDEKANADAPGRRNRHSNRLSRSRVAPQYQVRFSIVMAPNNSMIRDNATTMISAIYE